MNERSTIPANQHWKQEDALHWSSEQLGAEVEYDYTKVLDAFSWSVTDYENIIVGPYPGSPDVRVTWRGHGTASSLTEAWWQCERARDRANIMDAVYAQEEAEWAEEMEYRRTHCECNGGDPCACPDCDHDDCTYRRQYTAH